jgi:UDP-glucose 4-epimerase
MQKTILITGGAGYIGSHTAHLLIQKGYKVVIIDHAPAKDLSLPATYVCSDFACPVTLQTICSTYAIDAVMHFAAFTQVSASLAHPQDYYQNNVVKTCHLLDVLLAHGVKKFIFSSSCAVYGNPVYTPMDENHPCHPITPYGKSKQMIEEILYDYGQAYDFNYISLRYFNAAGAQPESGLGERHQPETHLIPLLLSALHNGSSFKIFGTDYNTPDGTCIRDFLHVRDIASAHYLALAYLEHNQTSDVFNLGTGHGFSVMHMVKAAEKIFKQELKVIYEKRRPGDPAILVANPAKATSLLGWHPQYSELNTILRSAHAFMVSGL